VSQLLENKLVQPKDVLIRFHEVALKGKNRPWFIKALVNSIRRATEGLGVAEIKSKRMLIHLTLNHDADYSLILEKLSRVSGIAKFCLSYRTETDYKKIENLVLQLASASKSNSFRITAHRADKSYALSSRELNVHLGNAVRLATGMAVNLKNPSLDLHVEVLPGSTFVYTEGQPGPGGLPVGTGGRTVTLMSGGIDSPVAAWHMIHRGSQTVLVHFHSFPLVDGRSKEKAMELAAILTEYQYDTRLYLIPFAEIQQKMLLSIPAPLRVVAYRRSMLRIAKLIAEKEHAIALVTGESLGQVSSQTMRNMATVGQAVDITILRPLVGMDKQEITDRAIKIGTYETSILTDTDCCTLFVPKSPATKTFPTQFEGLEYALGIEELDTQAVAKAEIKEYHWETQSTDFTD
jgi:thiamine biosynthesis protein ThiI